MYELHIDRNEKGGIVMAEGVGKEYARAFERAHAKLRQYRRDGFIIKTVGNNHWFAHNPVKKVQLNVRLVRVDDGAAELEAVG